MPEFMVGLNVGEQTEAVTVDAEDALAAAIAVKDQKPGAIINYVRKANQRGDRRHPHMPIGEN